MSALAFNNPRVQQLRRLIGRRSSRHDEGRFVVEGPVLVAEAVAAGWECEAQFVAAEADGVVQPGIEGAGAVFELADGVLERVASTETPQNPIAIVRMRDHGPVETLLAAASFVVVLDAIADPGNLGTILRSAEASGADLVVLTPGSVDPYNPKVVRASAGAIFHVPVVEATLDDVVASGLTTIGTHQPRCSGSHRRDAHRDRPHRSGGDRDGQRGRWTARRVDRLVGPDPTLGDDPARRAQRVAQRRDGHDRPRLRGGPPASSVDDSERVALAANASVARLAVAPVPWMDETSRMHDGDRMLIPCQGGPTAWRTATVPAAAGDRERGRRLRTDRRRHTGPVELRLRRRRSDAVTTDVVPILG